MARFHHITRCGLPGIDRVPFGMHACHFFNTRDELVAALVPYSLAGLRNNERCIWVTAPPLPQREAVQALSAAWDGTDDAIRAGALRILDFDHFYASPERLKGRELVQVLLEEEERALADGYSGLRLAGNASFLDPENWPAFLEYEQALTGCISSRRIVALCSYVLPPFNLQQVSDVMHAHHCMLERPDDCWQVAPEERAT
jgi:hypothetical protein